MTPDGGCDYVQIVNRAKSGCKKSLDELVEVVSPKLKTYIYRLTLDQNLTEDLLQDILMQMVKSLGNLRQSEKLWPWLYRTAIGRVYQHYRSKNLKVKTLSITDMTSENSHSGNYDIQDPQDDGLTIAMRNELVKSVFAAMEKLRLNYRNVLVLRCMEQRSFVEIAEIMDCSETAARVQFFRARGSLKKRLAGSGFGRAYVLPALALFAGLTSPSKAAVTIPAATAEVGTLAGIIGFATTKIAAMFLMLIVAAGIFLPTVFNDKNESLISDLPDRNQIKSFYFVEQAWNGAMSGNTNLLRGRSLSKGAYEQWFYFPQGVDGPMFFAMQRWNPQMTGKLCSWRQDGGGNYYFNSGNKTIYIHNYRLPTRDLQTRRLPSDSPEFTAFLDSVEGKSSDIDYNRDPKTNLLTGVLDHRFYNARDFSSSIKYNNFNQTEFDNFRYRWPADANVIDERDDLHKNLTAFIKITGQIHGIPINGAGCIVFVYDKLAEITPWLKIKIGNMEIIDNLQAAVLIKNGAKFYYPAGTFFNGLARPWLGIHTVDIVRRDAASQKIKFITTPPPQNNDEQVDCSVNIVFVDEPAKLGYQVGYYSDLLNGITFYANDNQIGQMNFEYIIDNEAIKNRPEIDSGRNIRNLDGLWLMRLANGSL
ncbi:MAG: sigma-70 family RNA polymerase sigma factor [Phycisphaerae bacterium]|jgi:RNA polymerase sigma-70 factor (ECF subfamily)